MDPAVVLMIADSEIQGKHFLKQRKLLHFFVRVPPRHSRPLRPDAWGSKVTLHRWGCRKALLARMSTILGADFLDLRDFSRNFVQRDSNSQPFDLESDALPLRHTPLIFRPLKGLEMVSVTMLALTVVACASIKCVR